MKIIGEGAVGKVCAADSCGRPLMASASGFNAEAGALVAAASICVRPQLPLPPKVAGSPAAALPNPNSTPL